MVRANGLEVATIACALLLAGCATPERSASPARVVAPSATFEITGRLSARHASEAATASFHWAHDRGRDQIELTSPLGQTIARMEGDESGTRLLAADGSVAMGDDWPALTQRALHFPLPVEGLASWIQGAPRDGASYALEPGPGDLPGVLRQDGWEIVYQAYGADRTGRSRPTRIALTYPDVELRIVIDAWQ